MSALNDLDVAGNSACGCISDHADLIQGNFDISIPTFPYQSTSDPAFEDHAVIPNEKTPVPAPEYSIHHGIIGASVEILER